MRTWKKKSYYALACLYFAAVSISSCAGPFSVLSARSLAVDPQDPCGGERAEFSTTRDYYASHILEGGAIGAAAGAMLGGLVSGKGGALVGAVAGTFAGGTAGYYASVEKRYPDRRDRVQSILDNLTAEQFHVRKTVETFNRLIRCRFEQANSIKYAIKTGTQSSDEAAKKLVQQRSFFDEEAAFANNLGINLSEREKDFQFAASKLDTDITANDPGSYNFDVRQVSNLASVAIPSLYVTYEHSIQTAISLAGAAFSISFLLEVRPPDPWPPAGGPTPVRQGPIKRKPREQS